MAEESTAALLEEYDALRASMSDAAVYSDASALKRIGKRIAELEPIVELLQHKRQLESALAESSAALSDPELAEIAAEEITKLQTELQNTEERLAEARMPKDPLDERSVLLEVRAGTGGEEAALFAAELLRMYVRYAEACSWKAEVLHVTEAGAGGIKEASVSVQGDGVYGRLKYEGGVHRVQRVPETENKGRVHTSAATVAVLPVAEEEDVAIRSDDLRVDTFRAGGAGGQHVNKTESAVRITHLPSGVAVACQSERSQLQNKAKAMEMLRARLFEHARQQRMEREGSLRLAQVGSGDRSEKIRTYNFPQDRLTDHRLQQNFHNLPGIMEGDLDEILDALQAKATSSARESNDG